MAINTFYDDVRAEIETQVQTSCASIITSWAKQGFTGLQALKMNVLEKLAKGQAAIANEGDGPYFVIDMGAMVDDSSGEWPITVEAKRLPVTIYVIDRGRKGRDDQNYVNGWARRIGLDLDAASLTYSQVIERHSSDSSAAQQAYDILEQNKSHIFIAAVTWEPGMLVGEV